MSTSITIHYDPTNPGYALPGEPSVDDLKDALIREWRREHNGTRRQVAFWSFHEDGFSPSDRHGVSVTYYRGTLVGHCDKYGSYPILGELRGIVYYQPEER